MRLVENIEITGNMREPPAGGSSILVGLTIQKKHAYPQVPSKKESILCNEGTSNSFMKIKIAAIALPFNTCPVRIRIPLSRQTQPSRFVLLEYLKASP